MVQNKQQVAPGFGNSRLLFYYKITWSQDRK